MDYLHWIGIFVWTMHGALARSYIWKIRLSVRMLSFAPAHSVQAHRDYQRRLRNDSVTAGSKLVSSLQLYRAISKDQQAVISSTSHNHGEDVELIFSVDNHAGMRDENSVE
jgi:hypothetical protein